MELIRAERILIKPSHPNHAACKRYCGAARRVYNVGLYQMRQAFVITSYSIHYTKLYEAVSVQRDGHRLADPAG